MTHHTDIGQSECDKMNSPIQLGRKTSENQNHLGKKIQRGKPKLRTVKRIDQMVR